MVSVGEDVSIYTDSLIGCSQVTLTAAFSRLSYRWRSAESTLSLLTPVRGRVRRGGSCQVHLHAQHDYPVQQGLLRVSGFGVEGLGVRDEG